jgi:uncharacterized protein (TIGR02118 family)
VVKFICFLKRRADMSSEDFHRYWREHHGPLFLSSRPAQRYALRYEQNHAIPESSAVTPDDYDGMSIMWFRSVEDFQAMFADPEFAPVLEDGNEFLDAAATKQLLTYTEESFIPGDEADASPRRRDEAP